MVERGKLKLSILSLIILFGVLSFVSAVVTNTNSGYTFTTIQEAINNASSGDTIEVYDGTYEPFNLEYKSDIIIRAADGEKPEVVGTTENVPSNRRIINVNGDNIEIRGLTIIGNGDKSVSTGFVGISVPGSNVIIEDNEVKDVLTGIQTNTGVMVGNNQIINNEISNVGYGISLQNNQNTVRDNILLDIEVEGMGVGNGETGNSIIEDNDFEVNFGAVNVQDYNSGLDFLEIAQENNFERLAFVTDSEGEFKSNALYSSILEAIDESVDGDTVLVGDGTYNWESENVVQSSSTKGLINIYEQITIKAVEGTHPIIDGSGVDGVFKIHANNMQGGQVVIDGFELTGDSITDIAVTALVCSEENPADIILKNNYIHGVAGGFDIWGWSGCASNELKVVKSIDIENNVFSNLGIENSEQGFGVMLEDLSNTGFASNTTFSAIVKNNSFANIHSGPGDEYGACIVIPRANEGNDESVNANLIGNKFNEVFLDIAVTNGDVSLLKIISNHFDLIGFGIFADEILNGPINAQNNYWGSNNPNFANLVSGDINYTPWIMQDFESVSTIGIPIILEMPNTNVTINITTSQTGTITVQRYSEDSHGGFSVASLGKFISIESTILNEEISSSEIRIYYTDAELLASRIDETTLKMYYYDREESEWEIVENSGVNKVENYVWAITNHFSDYGVGGYLDTEGPNISDVDIRPAYPNYFQR